MSVAEPKCPGCGGPSIRATWHCAACLEETMRTMTKEDWTRELNAICDHVLKLETKPDDQR